MVIIAGKGMMKRGLESRQKALVRYATRMRDKSKGHIVFKNSLDNICLKQNRISCAYTDSFIKSYRIFMVFHLHPIKECNRNRVRKSLDFTVRV